MQPQLDPSLYYLSNFHKALAWLRERHLDLLLAEEQGFLRLFGELALPSQALLVRMIMRKGVHFRASKLTYAEIGCPRHAAQALLDAGWIRNDAELALAELFDLLRKEELLEAFDARAHKALKKPELLARLAAEHGQSRPFAAWCPGLDEQVYSLAIDPLCERLRLMFFGNLQQDWSEFVLAELGIFRYEPVALSADSRVFRRRAEVDCYLALQRCRERGEAGEPIAEVLQQIAALDCATPFLAMRRAKLLFRLGQYLERAGELESALACYADCPFAGARLRRIRVLERLGRAAEAHALASQAAAAPENEAEAQG
ncbi:MAG: VRR-NUC domain-containing protein, partial [Pseudomonas sp.]|nr:VRR-NUC domain-containing protein [Pseudomonas sp.]